MRVTLLPELFNPPVQHALIIAILSYPLDDRHRIELDIDDPMVAAWLGMQSAGLQDEIRIGLELSTQAEVLEPSHTKVHVGRVAPTDLGVAPLRVHINDARRFLESPFVILLEDAHSDRAFLERMLTDEERRFLERRIETGFVRVDHGGGLGSMGRRVAADSAVPSNWHTLWVLFDSDAMRPGVPSADSEAVRAACGRITHHQLRRRYVESYITHQALQGWAAGQARRSVRDKRLELLRAFVGMADDQRHHYNMKSGLERDARRTDATAGDLYATVSDDDRQALGHGFGDDIADLFAGETVTDSDLRRDTGWTELRPALLDLLGRMR